jgi:hypothetical protein
MGLFDSIKKAWSGADFWDKQENAQQKVAFAQEDERKKREQQILAQQRADAAAKLNLERQRRQTQTIGGQDFSLPGVKPLTTPSNTPQQPTNQPPRQTFKPLELPQKGLDYVSRTRPETVNLDLLKKPAPGAPKRTFIGPDQQRNLDVTKKRFEEQVARDAIAYKSTPYKDKRNFLQQNIPIVSSGQDVEKFNGFDSDNRLAHDVAVAKNAEMSLDQLAMATPEERRLLDEQVRKMKNMADVGFGVDTALSLIPFGGAAVGAVGKMGARGAEELTMKQIINTVRKRITQDIIKRTIAGGAISTGIDVGAQQYITGDVDVTGLPLTFAQGAFLGATDPFDIFDPNKFEVDYDSRRNRPRLSGLELDVPGNEIEGVNLPEGVDVPEHIPEVNTVNNPNEVAPGVIKTPSAPRNTLPTINQQPTPEAPPVVAPTVPETPNLVSQPTPTPTQGAVPTGQTFTVPERPQTVNPEIQRFNEAGAQVDEAAVAPLPEVVTPRAAEVVTPTEIASEAAPNIVPPAASIDPAQVANARLNQLMDERAVMASEGLDTREIDAQIRALRSEATGGSSTIDPEADARLAEADAALRSQEAPVPPPAPSPVQEGVTSRPLTPEEMADRGFTGEQIDAVMARRAEMEAPTTVEAPVEEAPAPKTLAENLSDLRDRSESASSVEERALVNRLIRAEEQGSSTPLKASRLEAAREALAEFDSRAPEEAPAAATMAARTVAPEETSAPAKPTTEQAPKTVAPAEAEAPRKSGGKGSRPVKTVEEETSPVGTPTKKKKEKTVTPVTKTVEEAPTKPVAPTKSELQKGARDNVTKSGTVSKRWIEAQRKAGANSVDLRSAVEKVDGRKAPGTTPEEGAGGIALSGKKGVSVSGDVIDTTSKTAAAELGKSEASKTDAQSFIKKMATKEKNKEGFSQKDASTALEMQKKFTPDDPEFHELGDIYRKSGTQAAQTLNVRASQRRETGSVDDIVNSYVNRMREHTGMRLTNDDLVDIRRRVDTEVKARSKFNKAQEEYTADPSNPTKQKAALDALAEKQAARKEAMIEEMRTTVKQKGGDTHTKKELGKLIDTLQKDAEVWQMDYVDTSLLSSTGTPIANIINSGLGAFEEAIFGRPAAAIARKVTGTKIAAGNPFSRAAQKFGLTNLRKEASARTTLPSKNIAGTGLNGLKNVITTVNELGNTQIDAQAHTAAKAEYKATLKEQYPKRYGDKANAKELDMLADYQATTDPFDIRQKYTDAAFNVQGMGAVLGKSGKSAVASIENRATKGISEGMQSVKVPKSVADITAKLTTRVLFGFPTIVTRSAAQGGRRVTGGLPTFLQAAGVDVSKPGGIEKRAMLIKQGVKELGSGGALVAAGYAAASGGNITGAYPDDKATQDEWAKEGKSEWAIKIGGDWHNMPRVLGPFAIPFMVGAQMGQARAEGDVTNIGDATKAFGSSLLKSAGATLPMNQVSDTLTTLNYLFDSSSEKTKNNALAKLGGNALRIMAPASGLLNQMAQSTTKYIKDTTAENPVEGILNYVYSGLPGFNQHLPNKTSKDGTLLTNTSVGGRLVGAKSSENAEGTRQVAQQATEDNEKVSAISGDKNIYNSLTPETQTLLNNSLDPKKKHKVTEENYKTIYKEVEGVSDKMAEEGNWTSYGRTLKMKQQTLEADPASTKADKDKNKRQITQADILEKNKVDAKIYSLYTLSAEKGGVSASDFKKMINKEDYPESYDPETAKALWLLDKSFADAGVSENTTGTVDPWTKQKYAFPDQDGSGGSGGGKGGGKAPKLVADFGMIGTFAKPDSPTAKYQALKDRTSPIPNLTTAAAKTNLKKKISVARGVQL